jgi:hypothetical protein
MIILGTGFATYLVVGVAIVSNYQRHHPDQVTVAPVTTSTPAPAQTPVTWAVSAPYLTSPAKGGYKAAPAPLPTPMTPNFYQPQAPVNTYQPPVQPTPAPTCQPISVTGPDGCR